MFDTKDGADTVSYHTVLSYRKGMLFFHLRFPGIRNFTEFRGVHLL